jgi:outer membrane protein assembly factor BamA
VINPVLTVQPGAGVALEVVVVPGEHFLIDSVVVTGCAEDLQPLARRVLDIREGSAFDAARLDGAAADLRSTQLFSGVTLTTEPSGPGLMELTAELADARMRSWRASVGTWNDNPWMVTTGWTHRNLFRRGRGLYIDGTYATHEQRVGAAYFWLGWLSPRARSSVVTEWLREDEDAYLSVENSLELVQSFRPRNRALSNVGVGLSRVDVQTRSPDVTDIPESQDWLLELWFDRKWDWTNDMMFPTRGGYAKIGLTYAPPGGPFKASYAKVQGDGAAYLPVGERIVLAARLRLGWSRPLGEADDLLANRRFFAGGYNTMRGFERRGLGPKDSAGSARGGQVVGLAGAETRLRLAGIFDLAFFADSGQVWREPQDVAWSEMELALGVDLDLRSPLGPVRVGHAWTVTSVSIGTPRTLWHFGIGYPW